MVAFWPETHSRPTLADVRFGLRRTTLSSPLGIGKIKMLGSALSVFSKSIDFHAALREVGDVDLIPARGGKFWARMSQIWLLHMRLIRCEERNPRIAFISIPPNMVRVTLPPNPDVSLVWDGIGTRPAEIVTHSAGHRFHERTDGPSRS